MSRPSLLIIANQSLATCSGQVNGYELLVGSGELEFVQAFPYRGNGRSPETLDFQGVRDTIERSSATHVMIWSPGRFPESPEQFAQLDAALRSRPLIYWEGDAWGSRKPITTAMRLWLERADVVFTVSGEPQTSLLRTNGGTEVKRTFHTYCHRTFAAYEIAKDVGINRSATMIGGMHMRVPLPIMTGLPGGWDRRRLGLKLKRRLGNEFVIFGSGWPSSASDGPLRFDQQIDAVMAGKVSVNWDHYPTYQGYFSDRLPIALLAGRPHVTNLHPGMEWAPTPADGLHQEATVQAVIDRTLAIANMDPLKIQSQGRSLHSWVVDRLSHRQAARHVMSAVLENVGPVRMEPWSLVR